MTVTKPVASDPLRDHFFTEAVADRAEALGAGHRTVAYVIALETIDQAARARGTSAFFQGSD